MEHLFDVEVAEQYGVDAAVMVRHLKFWITKNKADRRHFHEDRTWTYGAARSFAEIFPYWTAKQVKRILSGLIEVGVLRKGCFNKNGYDRTAWYAFEDEAVFLGKHDSRKIEKTSFEGSEPICPNGTMEKPKRDNGKAQTVQPIPDVLKDKRKGGGEKMLKPTPEEFSFKNFEKAKDRAEGLPGEFVRWFEREVFGRWDKLGCDGFAVATLEDWHELFWVKFDADIRRRALRQHRKTQAKSWKPVLVDVIKVADSIVGSAVKRDQVKKRSERDQRIQGLKERPIESLTDVELSEIWFELPPFKRATIGRKRPDLVKLIRGDRRDNGSPNKIREKADLIGLAIGSDDASMADVEEVLCVA